MAAKATDRKWVIPRSRDCARRRTAEIKRLKRLQARQQRKKEREKERENRSFVLTTRRLWEAFSGILGLSRAVNIAAFWRSTLGELIISLAFNRDIVPWYLRARARASVNVPGLFIAGYISTKRSNPGQCLCRADKRLMKTRARVRAIGSLGGAR